MRIIGSVILGYLAIVLLIFAGLTFAWFVMGDNQAFRPGVFDISLRWGAVSLVVGLGAAVVGGWIARSIARDPRGPWILAGLVVALGLAMALPVIVSPPEALGPRTEALGMFDAMQQAQTPLWMMLLNPLVGAVGVLVGGLALTGGTHSRATGST
jgi:hypothetical protein